MRAICLAKGSRDDIQPVAVVARALQRRGPGTAARLVTHLDHKASLACAPNAARACLDALVNTVIDAYRGG